jgi:hypothetical protein
MADGEGGLLGACTASCPSRSATASRAGAAALSRLELPVVGRRSGPTSGSFVPGDQAAIGRRHAREVGRSGERMAASR